MYIKRSLNSVRLSLHLSIFKTTDVWSFWNCCRKDDFPPQHAINIYQSRAYECAAMIFTRFYHSSIKGGQMAEYGTAAGRCHRSRMQGQRQGEVGCLHPSQVRSKHLVPMEAPKKCVQAQSRRNRDLDGEQNQLFNVVFTPRMMALCLTPLRLAQEERGRAAKTLQPKSPSPCNQHFHTHSISQLINTYWTFSDFSYGSDFETKALLVIFIPFRVLQVACRLHTSS